MHFVYFLVVIIVQFEANGSSGLYSAANISHETHEDLYGRSTTSPSCPVNRSRSLCIYVVVGFTAGITTVLVVGGIVICCIKQIRQRRLAHPNKTRLRSRKGRFQIRNKTFRESNFDTGGIEESVVSGLPGEGSSPLSQSSWYDSETESTNRKTRCQKCGAMVSTITLDKMPEKHTKSSTVPARPDDFTWKGLIDGTEEVINTELRAPPGEQEPNLPPFFDPQPLFSEHSGVHDIHSSSKTYQVLTTAEIEGGKHDAL